MMRFLTTLLLPIWLFVGCLGFVQPVKASAKHLEAQKHQESTLSKVVAAPVAFVQLQAPQADWCTPTEYSFDVGFTPANQSIQPLRANGRPASLGFGHRYFTHSIALRAP